MDLDALAKAWAQRDAEQRARSAERAEQARQGARRAARALVDEFGAREVWLFGSLVWGPVHARSDVDLAVRGIRPERYFAALSRACQIVGEQVDLVSLEDCAESLRQRVREKGVRLDAG